MLSPFQAEQSNGNLEDSFTTNLQFRVQSGVSVCVTDLVTESNLKPPSESQYVYYNIISMLCSASCASGNRLTNVVTAYASESGRPLLIWSRDELPLPPSQDRIVLSRRFRFES